jgi:hypothetical protein
VHLTLLAPDGSGKADVEKPKLVVGPPGVLPIVLAPVNDLLGLAITEGIEEPWPPSSTDIWHIVRRNYGFTVCRSIQLASEPPPANAQSICGGKQRER